MKKFLVFIVLTISLLGYSQDTPEQYRITSMVDFTELPTGSPTGTPDANIPLYQISTAGSLNVDLTLQYNLFGSINSKMKGSQFGDAWNLNFQGTISRIVKKKNNVPSQSYRVPDERTFSNTSTPNVQGEDFYTFNVLGLEGKFKLNKVNNQVVAVLHESNDYLSVSIDYNSSSPSFTRFTVKDKNGMNYIFEQAGNVTENKYYFSQPNPFPSNSVHSPSFNPDLPADDYIVSEHYGPAYVKSWFLTKITDRYGKDLVNVEYEKAISFFEGDLYFLKKINIINKGSINFTNTLNGDKKASNIVVKDLKDEVIKKLDFLYTRQSHSMDNGKSIFSKLYLYNVKIFNRGETKSEDYTIDYKRSNFNQNLWTINSDGYLWFKTCHTTFSNFNDIATNMSLQRIVYPTGGATLYQFEPNTFSSTQYIQNNKFNKDYLTITPTYNSALSRYYFDVPAGYEKLYIKISANGSNLYNNNQLVKYLVYSGTNKMEDYCRKPYEFNEHNLNNSSGSFYVSVPSAVGIEILAIKTKDLSETEQFEYGKGIRIKRIANFTTAITSNYLESNSVAVKAEKELIFNYSENNNSKFTSGRLSNVADPFAEQFIEKKLLYEKVTVTSKEIGKTEGYFNNVALTDNHWYRKNMLLKSATTYDNNLNVLQNTVTNRQYTNLGIQSIVSQEQTSKKEYEQSGYLESNIISNYDTTNRQLSSTAFEDNLGKVIKAELDYQTINNAILNTQTRNYINNNLSEQALKSYDWLGNSTKTEFKTPEMSVYEQAGTTNHHYYNDLLLGYTQLDGTHVTMIYGYNDTQLVAKLINLEAPVYYAASGYGALRSNISNQSNQAGTGYSEANLKTTLNSLRTTFPNALVTTYTYKPMVGISTITDENGQTTTYEYDTFNRLSTVKDYLGNILKEYQYNFTN